MKFAATKEIKNDKHVAVLQRPKDYHDLIESYPDGEKLVITVRRYTDELSDSLRKYYFSIVVGAVMQWTGESEESIHLMMKKKYSNKKSVFSDKSELSLSEKEKFVYNVREFWMEYSSGELVIPPKGRPE